MDKCAFDLGRKCIALNARQCVGCNFYKTPEELEERRGEAARRINTLPPEEKNYIRHKYYGSERRAFTGE